MSRVHVAHVAHVAHGVRSRARLVARFACVAVLLLITSFVARDAAATPSPMSRDAILGYAKQIPGYSYYWGHGSWRSDGTQVGSCSGSCPGCSHTGIYGADCSGFVAKAWQIPSPSPITTDSHPYATYNFVNDSTWWTSVPRGSLVTMDALTYNTGGAGHILLYEKDDPWGSFWAYECKGCSYGCVHGVRTAGSAYVGRRRVSLVDATPPPPPPPATNVLDAAFVSQGTDAKPDASGKAQYTICAGQKVHFWFELKNTGTASWVDVSDTAPTGFGRAVRLGVPGTAPDPFTGKGRVSVNEAANNDVHPASAGGTDCNDKPLCQRTVFAKSGGIEGISPTTPGIYKTSWKLVDESRAWFGPDVSLSFNVLECPGTPPIVTDSGAETSDEGDPGDAGGTAPGSDGAVAADSGSVNGSCGCRAAGTGTNVPTHGALAMGAFAVAMMAVRVGRRRRARGCARG